jgi:hypothetical protein
MIRIASVTVFLVLMGVSAFSATCSAKIEDTLCTHMANLGFPYTVPIKIVLPRPADSLSGTLEAMKPAIDSLYAKYKLRVLKTPPQISASSTVSYDYVMYAVSFPDTILHLAAESMVSRIELLQSYSVANSTLPDFAILSTQFPYDTVLTGVAAVLADNAIVSSLDTVRMARYGFQFRFAWLPTPLLCCPEMVAKDFTIWNTNDRGCSDIRFPQDSDLTKVLMTGGWYFTSYLPAETSYVSMNQNYQTHEYRFQLHSAMLYMKVMDVYGLDSMRIRFDTMSFLPTGVIPEKSAAGNNPSNRIDLALGKNVILVRGMSDGEGCRIKIFDLRGRILFSSAAVVRNGKIPLQEFRGNGICIVKISAAHGEFIAMTNVVK